MQSVHGLCTWNRLFSEVVFKSVAREEVETDACSHATSTTPSLQRIRPRHPHRLQTLHAASRVIPGKGDTTLFGKGPFTSTVEPLKKDRLKCHEKMTGRGVAFGEG